MQTDAEAYSELVNWLEKKHEMVFNEYCKFLDRMEGKR